MEDSQKTKLESALPSPAPVFANAWRPLRQKYFRSLLIADFVSDVGSYFQAVGAAWLMTSLTPSPLYIALIQTTSSLPLMGL